MGSLSKKVGAKIRKLRENLHIKQYELAKMLDMEPSNLTRIENGNQLPKEENIIKIAQILGVNEKDLFDFGETHSKDELMNKIITILKNSTCNEVEFFYQLLFQYKKQINCSTNNQ